MTFLTIYVTSTTFYREHYPYFDLNLVFFVSVYAALYGHGHARMCVVCYETLET